MKNERPRIIVLNTGEGAPPDYDRLLAADGWSVEHASVDAPPLIQHRKALPIVLLHLGAPAPAIRIVVKCLHQLAPEIPVIATGRALCAERVALVRDVGLHGVWDTDEEPERLLELVASAGSMLRRLRTASEQQDLDGLLVAKLCHDLRGALHAIRGYSEMLDPNDPAVDLAVVGERIDALSRNAVDIAAGYLELARLGQMDGETPRDAVRVDTLLADLRADAVSRIGDRPIQLAANVSSPGGVIQTDEKRLRAVLAELLTNAIKFTAAGRVRLAATSGDGYAEFRVTDDGSGLSEPQLGGDVAAFEQARTSLLAPIPGQGIGLAMALRLTEQIGGTLTVEPASTGGTSFRLLVPDRPAAVAVTGH